MCDRPAPVSALCPRVEISPVAVVVFALARLEKNQKNNYNNNYNNKKISRKKKKKFESGVLAAPLLWMGRLACQQYQSALLSVQGDVRAEL